jgi:hypothetical protein
VFDHKGTGRLLETGEPCALKGARTVRGRRLEKDCPVILLAIGQVSLRKYQYLASPLPYSQGERKSRDARNELNPGTHS